MNDRINCELVRYKQVYNGAVSQLTVQKPREIAPQSAGFSHLSSSARCYRCEIDSSWLNGVVSRLAVILELQSAPFRRWATPRE